MSIVSERRKDSKEILKMHIYNSNSHTCTCTYHSCSPSKNIKGNETTFKILKIVFKKDLFMYVCTHVMCHRTPEEGKTVLVAGVTETCGLLGVGRWDLNPGLGTERPALPIAATSSLQPETPRL